MIQQGGIPVAVTLQQLHTALSMDKMLYTTCLELKPGSASIDKCETAFVVFASGHSHNMPHQPQVVIGECKAAGGTITREDAEHLAKVADALPYRRLNVFILFAKTGTFSEQEVEACSLAQHMWHFLGLERRDHHRKVQRKAFQFFEDRGREPGRDWEDWFRAEDELGKRD